MSRRTYTNTDEGDAIGDVQAALDAGLNLATPHALEPGAVVSVTTPDGARSETIDLEHLLENPRRVTGSVRLHTVADFVAYVKRHDESSTTTIWVNGQADQITAVLNDHAGVFGADERPGWGDHRARLDLEVTDEWSHWVTRNGTMMSQEQFAEHIEEGRLEIISPDGATMLELAQSMRAKTSVDWKSAVQLKDGQVGFQYVEETQASAGARGEIEIPERFELAIAPFLGEDRYKVGARLRYRVRDGALTIGYKLDRPDDVRRDAVAKISENLADQFPSSGGDRVFQGVPR